MRYRFLVIGLLLGSLCVSGCADGSREKGLHEQAIWMKHHVDLPAPIDLGSPVLRSAQPPPPCRHGVSWIPLHWGRVPPQSAELVVYISRYTQSVRSGTAVASLVSATLIGGLRPSRHQLSAGDVPHGAFVLQYRPNQLCAPLSLDSEYMVQLFALAENQRISGVRQNPEAILTRFGTSAGRGAFTLQYEVGRGTLPSS
jgi:hypothetical protein